MNKHYKNYFLSDVILVNRGWIPRKHVRPESRSAGQISQEVELTCVVRRGEQRPQFTPDHKGGVFLYRYNCFIQMSFELFYVNFLFVTGTCQKCVP